MTTRPVLLASLLVLGACDGSSPDTDGGAEPPMADAGPPVTLDTAAPAFDGAGDCDGLAGYEVHSAGDPALDWSAIHADLRFFGDHEDPFAIDALLVAALGGDSATPGDVDGSDAAFAAYAEAAPRTCLTPAWSAPGPSPAPVRSDVAWLNPGEPVELGDAEHVLVDLRAAPEGPALEAFLAELAAATLAEPVRYMPFVRAYNGMRDEAIAPLILMSGSVYRSRVQGEVVAIAGEAPRPRRLGFVLSDRVAPTAARLVAALRSTGHAAILGQGLDVAVGERVARPAGEGSMMYRAMMLFDSDLAPFPDRVEADVPFDAQTVAEIEEAFVALGDLSALPRPSGTATRPELQPLPDRTEVTVTSRGEGTRQADLIILHGATATFYPYWNVVDSDPDGRLAEALALAREEWTDAQHLAASIRYFAHVLHDSHGYFFYLGDEPAPVGAVGTLPVLLDSLPGGEPVVRLSDLPELSPGDVVVAVDGTPVDDVFAEARPYICSSASSARRNGISLLYSVVDTETYRVRAPDGSERDVAIDASTLGEERLPWPSRAHGPLDDLGHPDVYYVNLTADVIAGHGATIRSEMHDARAVVLDSRGYPNLEAWGVVQELLVEGSPGARLVEAWRSVLGAHERIIPQRWPVEADGFAGEVVVLVAPTTQSQAEHLVLTMQAAGRVTVVGRPTAGANGNITSIALPGQVAQSWTGMLVYQPDASTFHGVGVLVDEPVDLDADELAAGVDPELTRALELLTP